MRERKINGSNYYHLTFYLAGSSFLVHQLERKNFSWNFLCLCHFRIRVVPEYAKILWGSKGWGDSTLFESFFEFLFPSSFTYFYYIVYFSESSDSFVYSVQSFFYCVMWESRVCLPHFSWIQKYPICFFGKEMQDVSFLETQENKQNLFSMIMSHAPGHPWLTGG